MTTLIFLLAFAIRLIACITPAIWYDEAYSLHIASLPFEQIIGVHDFTPPLWEIILHPFVMLWPSVITIRLIALAFSMLAMFTAYRIAQALNYTRTQTSFALLMIAVLPGVTWFSSDGRSYAMFAFLYLAGWLCVLNKNNIGLFLVSAVMLYTHVTSVFFIATLFWVAIMRGETLRRLAVIGAGLFFAWLPWIFVMLDILKTTTESKPPFVTITPDYFLNQFSASFWIGSSPLLYVAGIALIIVTVAIDFKSHALTMSPIILMTLASVITGFNVITYRTISPILMPFAVLAGRTMLSETRRTFLFFAWMFCFVFSAAAYDFEIKGGTQAQAAQMIQSQPAQVVYATLTVALPFDYYLRDETACILQLDPEGALIGDYDFGFSRCTPAQLKEFLFIVPNDPIIPPAAYTQMQSIASAGELIGELNYLQISPVQIYLVKK